MDKEVTVDSRGEAEEVFMKMQDLISEYGLVSVADFYDIVGIKGNYTDNRYGWTNIRNAESVRLRDGSYLLNYQKRCRLIKQKRRKKQNERQRNYETDEQNWIQT